MIVAIIGFTKIKYMPYLNLYLDELDVNRNDVHLIYWDRDDNNDATTKDGVTLHPINIKMKDSISIAFKIPRIILFKLFAIKTIRDIDPDFLIVLHSTTAFTIRRILKKRYKGKYIFDYRDITYELKSSFYKKTIGKLVDWSYVTFTSSDGFRFVLPDNHKIYTSHNIISDAERIHANFKRDTVTKQLPIRVSFWGLLRHYNINKIIIDKLCADPRFELHYYGRAQGSMLQLMKDASKSYENFYYHGEYYPEDRMEFAKETDLLLNIYENKGTMQYAMGNKYYDGIVFGLPQLCLADTYMGKQCQKSDVGLACDPNDSSFVDNVAKYYLELDYNIFLNNCDLELNRVIEEMQNCKLIIKEAYFDETINN